MNLSLDKNKTELLQYVRNSCKSFEELPFNEVDATVLATMSYICIHEEYTNNFSDEGMPIRNLLCAEYFDEMCTALPIKEDQIQLIFEVCASPRYRNIRIKYYRNELYEDISLQFAGIVFSISEWLHVVAFRGTDKSFVGWKENVLLLMRKDAPAQMMAVNYLNGVSKKLKGRIIVTGHSKGGNLASHAFAHCEPEVRDKIEHVYNLDGPGFLNSEIIDSDMLCAKDKITKITPAGSPIGIILQNEVEPIVIKSNKHALMQHYPFSWVIIGNEFERVNDGKNNFKMIIDNIDAWAEDASDDEIQEFAEIFFEIFEKADYKTYDELSNDISLTLMKLFKNMKGMDSKKRKKMFSILKDALGGSGKRKVNSNTEKDELNASDSYDLEVNEIDWKKIDNILNDLETKKFGEKYNLYLD